MTFSMINFEKLQETPLMDYPYPYQIIENFIRFDKLPALLSSFPQIDKGGSFPLDSFQIDEPLQALMTELESDTFREHLATTFEMNLTNRPTMTTLRGFSRRKDGRIHTDSKSKLLTVLLYLNLNWDSEMGRLRILNQAHNMEDYTDEVSPEAGTCLIFKVTPNCWHGYPKFIGRRQSLQFNYTVNEEAADSHLSRHRFSAKIKAFFSRFKK
jgi:SM-20-related protein